MKIKINISPVARAVQKRLMVRDKQHVAVCMQDVGQRTLV
jgi:hypothetical protein